MAIIELDQACETPVSVYRRGVFRVRYAYARAKDARSANLRGEDYLVFRAEPDWLAFAVCDGVGSSFFGGLAAQIVGERLLTWLARDETRKLLDANPSAETALASLRAFLDEQATPASQMIAQKDISGLANQFARRAYQEKREKHGSQSNFVCGLVDAKSRRAWLFSLGDASLRAWLGNTELPLDLTRASEQSWSSKHGVAGELHFRALSLDEADTLIAYSDGLNPKEGQVSPQLLSADLETHIAALGEDSKSDDISFLEIHLTPDGVPSPDDIVPLVRGTLSSVPASVPTVPAPQKAARGWALGLALFIVGGVLGLMGGYALRGGVVNLFATPTPTLTATAAPSETPIPSPTVAPTLTLTSTFTATATETSTPSPTVKTGTATTTKKPALTLTITITPKHGLKTTPSITPTP